MSSVPWRFPVCDWDVVPVSHSVPPRHRGATGCLRVHGDFWGLTRVPDSSWNRRTGTGETGRGRGGVRASGGTSRPRERHHNPIHKEITHLLQDKEELRVTSVFSVGTKGVSLINDGPQKVCVPDGYTPKFPAHSALAKLAAEPVERDPFQQTASTDPETPRHRERNSLS